MNILELKLPRSHNRCTKSNKDFLIFAVWPLTRHLFSKLDINRNLSALSKQKRCRREKWPHLNFIKGNEQNTQPASGERGIACHSRFFSSIPPNGCCELCPPLVSPPADSQLTQESHSGPPVNWWLWAALGGESTRATAGHFAGGQSLKRLNPVCLWWLFCWWWGGAQDGNGLSGLSSRLHRGLLGRSPRTAAGFLHHQGPDSQDEGRHVSSAWSVPSDRSLVPTTHHAPLSRSLSLSLSLPPSLCYRSGTGSRTSWIKSWTCWSSTPTTWRIWSVSAPGCSTRRNKRRRTCCIACCPS